MAPNEATVHQRLVACFRKWQHLYHHGPHCDCHLWFRWRGDTVGFNKEFELIGRKRRWTPKLGPGPYGSTHAQVDSNFEKYVEVFRCECRERELEAMLRQGAVQLEFEGRCGQRGNDGGNVEEQDQDQIRRKRHLPTAAALGQPAAKLPKCEVGVDELQNGSDGN